MRRALKSTSGGPPEGVGCGLRSSWGSDGSCRVLRIPHTAHPSTSGTDSPVCCPSPAVRPCSRRQPLEKSRGAFSELEAEAGGSARVPEALMPQVRVWVGLGMCISTQAPGAGAGCWPTCDPWVQKVTGTNRIGYRACAWHLVPQQHTGCACGLGSRHRPGKPCLFPRAPGALASGSPVSPCV